MPSLGADSRESHVPALTVDISHENSGRAAEYAALITMDPVCIVVRLQR
jgi:hypothetical protein